MASTDGREEEDGLCTETGNLQVLDSSIPPDAEGSSSEADTRLISKDHHLDLNDVCEDLNVFGFPLAELYKFSLEFYRKGKKALNLSYDDKMMLTAYWKQISFGSYDHSKMPDVGYLDVIGNDRRKAWQALGDMSSELAMENFCKLLKEKCNEYSAYLEAQKRDLEEKERIQREAEERERAQKEAEEKARKEEEERKKAKEEERRRLIEEQKRIEEEAARAAEAQRKLEEKQAEEERLKKQEEDAAEHAKIMEQNKDSDRIAATNSYLHNTDINGVAGRLIAPASLWTRPKLKEFIHHVKRDASSVIVVGRGETVTIRVPTHENGSCLFWEFATESYDVGFGVYFEWSASASHEVSVNVDESDEESDEDITKEEQENKEGAREKPLVDEVLPVLRRNSHMEVIVGSHIYPGQGVYLLKFDNSYSLLRSKTLYYRVYYTRSSGLLFYELLKTMIWGYGMAPTKDQQECDEREAESNIVDTEEEVSATVVAENMPCQNTESVPRVGEYPVLGGSKWRLYNVCRRC